MEQEDQVGAATGLAYTAVGGDTLSIEVSHYPGKGKLTLNRKTRRRDARICSSSI